jgi:SAM-dependent methyltransferase
MTVDFGSYAEIYQRHRRTQPAVLAELLRFGCVTGQSTVLEIGCGTANYLSAIAMKTGANGIGVDPSAEMQRQALDLPSGLRRQLLVGSAEALPIATNSIDFAFMVDAVHVVTDRAAMAREVARALRPGGRLAIATDSEEDIRNRVPLRSHFPETVDVELKRYPPLANLAATLGKAGLTDIATVPARWEYDLTDIGMYRDRAASSLRLIDDDAFARGLARLEADLAQGPVKAVSRYTIVEAINGPNRQANESPSATRDNGA